ncbi:hypothetical protein E3N88_31884 [Mikania micrantha]|uniref:Uncharacterized protein n=1 Tax=Mikania micrantha TaxID=192012 RepID=A0A5N6M6V3_9ASTR|nr:hypothetical protein E3N88_31884 [Mikania micrantha]
MSPKIDKITTKLLDLVNEKNLLGLNDNVERATRSSRRLEETSLVVESKVIGRERDKEALLGKLLGGESSSSQTTNFNVEWELLQRPFTVGAPGSKVLVTTRKTTVASAMDSDQAYDLKLLSDEEALSLFAQHASNKQNFDDVNRKLKLYEFFFMLDDKMDFDDRQKGLKKVHHLSFIREKYAAYQKFKALQKPRRLRTLLAMPVRGLGSWEKFYMSNKVLVEILPQLQSLRVLCLANYNITQVPESIGRLKHMRYLNLSNNTRITCLPEQVGDLPNLQSLLLSGCHNLSSLPASIVKLTNLRHLDISDTWALNKMPLGLGGLTSLQTLSKIVIGEADEFNICDLKGLVHLQGQLSIKELQKVKNELQAKETKLQHKKGICDLELEWSDVFDDSRNKATEYDVIEGLRPFEKLSSLKILHYGGKVFPGWVGDRSFVCLTQLTLRGCKSCKYLPALGYLPSLQKLFVGSMDGLKSLGSEFLGPSNGVAFPSLEVLKFTDMKGWEKWSTISGGKGNMFPFLREISMINCGKLDEVAIEPIPSLQDLHVQGCSEAVLKSMVGVSSRIVRLTIKNIRRLTQLTEEVFEHLKKVEHLSFSECDELTHLWESEAWTCKNLLNLQSLKVYMCKNLVSLGEEVVQSVTEVNISSCESLESYNCPSSIKKLEISNCPSLTSLSTPKMDGLPSTLKFLHIQNCDNVNNFLPSIEYLDIYGMPNLRQFPEGCFVHLTRLVIEGCDNIESIPDNGYGFLPFFCLRNLSIINCKNLKLFPHEHLQSLASLEEMIIHGCLNLDCSFPCGLWPPNLSLFRIGRLKKPISEMGMQNFPTSLVTLVLYGGDSGLVTFAKTEEEVTSSSSFVLPSSLTSLYLHGFKELESLSEGSQHLTCLQHLHIYNCSNLRDLPETLLPSLSSLRVDSNCSHELRKKCSRSRKGKYWPMISQIPDLQIE